MTAATERASWVARYLRAESGFMLPEVRAGVADLLDGHGPEALEAAVAAVYAAGGHGPSRLDIYARVWAASSAPELVDAARWLRAAREAVWVRALGELGP